MSNQATSTGENEVYRIRLHKIEWFPIAVCCLTIIGIPYALIMALSNSCIRMAVTNRNVYRKTGILTRDIDSMRLSAIESIRIHQGVFGTLLSYGEVTIFGRGGDALLLPRVADPNRVKDAIEDAISENSP